jgi:CheY-like chemotaxis protein
MGLEADAVFDGQRALEAATENQYDLVLMDLQMPKMDGLEATAAIRFKEGQSRHTPIVAVTANAMPGDRERRLAAGMDGYISKPVSLDTLQQAISGYLQGDARASRLA